MNTQDLFGKKNVYTCIIYCLLFDVGMGCQFPSSLFRNWSSFLNHFLWKGHAELQESVIGILVRKKKTWPLT